MLNQTASNGGTGSKLTKTHEAAINANIVMRNGSAQGMINSANQGVINTWVSNPTTN